MMVFEGIIKLIWLFYCWDILKEYSVKILLGENNSFIIVW